MNSITIATAFETRIAGIALRITRNGMTTGNVEQNTRRNTPRAPSQSSLRSPARAGGSGRTLSRSCMLANSSRVSIAAISGGRALAIRRCASCGSLFAHRLKYRKPTSMVREVRHQVEQGVDDPPRDIAAQRTDQHRANVLASRPRRR